MRIAIYNPFLGKSVAEFELGQRICLAAQNLSWKAIETASSEKIRIFKPDFVLVMHFNTPKLMGFPTYGCMWNPPVFFRQYEIAMECHGITKNILSYDAYLSSSKKVDLWLQNGLNNTPKKFFIAPFYTSCNQTDYLMPILDNPHLVYIGSNWDGVRFGELFKQLDLKAYMRVYGAPKGWNYLNQSYKGLLPFDGTSVLNTLRECGVGLCLHKNEHTEAGIPSMRIFEIVASGALAICGDHPFIREAFGDLVLYIDSNLNTTQKVEQISAHISWIKNHKQQALEMSKEAHKIFLQKYSLEKLLLGIIPHHQKLVEEKGFISQGKPNLENLSNNQVQFIVRVGGRDLGTIRRCLDSIANQTYKNVSAIVIKYKEVEGISELLAEYAARIPIKIIESKLTGYRSTQLKDGINAIDSGYFAILDDDDIIHPNHVSILVSLLGKYKHADVAYSGSIRVWEKTNSSKLEDDSETSDLAHFETFDIRKIINFNNFITSNSYIARSSIIGDIFQTDPQLPVSEDFFLLLHLCRKARFIFSYEATCEFYWREDGMDNATFEDMAQTNQKMIIASSPKWIDAGNRILHVFWNQDFLCNEVDSSSSFSTSKTKKFYQFRYSKLERLMMNSKSGMPLPVYNYLRKIYLNLSGGGKANKSPDLLAKLLVYLKTILSE